MDASDNCYDFELFLIKIQCLKYFAGFSSFLANFYVLWLMILENKFRIRSIIGAVIVTGIGLDSKLHNLFKTIYNLQTALSRTKHMQLIVGVAQLFVPQTNNWFDIIISLSRIFFLLRSSANIKTITKWFSFIPQNEQYDEEGEARKLIYCWMNVINFQAHKHIKINFSQH